MSRSLRLHGLYVAHQDPLSMGFYKQEYWSGLPCPPLGDLSNPGLLHCRQILYHLSHQRSPRILEWLAYPFVRGSSWPRNWTGSPALQVDSLPAELSAAAAKSLQSCPTLCDPIDGSPPGSPAPGILQARILEWVAISSSRGSSQHRIELSLVFPALQEDSS